MTGLVLAEQIVEGNLAMNTTLSSLLSESLPKFELEGGPITLHQLLTQKSGFPREGKIVQESFDAGNENLHVGLDEEDLLDQLNIIKPGEVDWDYSYSNFAFSVLAYVLDKHSNTT